MVHEWLLKCLGLFLETFVQEDLAILTGGVLAANDTLPVPVVFLTLVSGFLTGDLFIYGLGWGAHKVPWLYRKIYSEKVETAKAKIEKNLTSTLVVVRLVPGLLFPTYIACGFIGVSFGQFALTTLATGATYTAIFLTILVKVGQAFIPVIGHWIWFIIFASGLSVMTVRFIRQRRLAALTDDNTVIPVEPASMEVSQELKGMPSLKAISRRVAVSEKIPQSLFYSPVAFRWLLMGIKYRSLLLPTVSNPLIEAGGLWGESKSRLMDQIGPDQREWVAPYSTVRISNGISEEEMVRAVKEAMDGMSLAFPVVVKPDIGWQGYGVRAIGNEDELRSYMMLYPKDTTLIIQQLIPWEGEAGVFYSRLPGEEYGKIISLTLRYYPHVIGDGINTVSQLLQKDERTRFKLRFYRGKEIFHKGLSEEKLNAIPQKGEVFRLAFIGSIRVGGLYRDGSEYITESLQGRFASIGKSMPEFYFGRFDIKFKSVESLMDGEDFRIFEVNGAGAEAIHVWDASTPLFKMYRELFRYQSLMFEISALNRKRGFKPMQIKEFYSFTKGYNSLISSYPPSE
mgnify:CR=1 FL=1